MPAKIFDLSQLLGSIRLCGRSPDSAKDSFLRVRNTRSALTAEALSLQERLKPSPIWTS